MSKTIVPCPVCGDDCDADAPYLNDYAKREEVIEAAKAWDAFGSIENVTLLRYTVACLPKPASLAEKLREVVQDWDGPRASRLMLEAADELERRGAK